MRSTRLILAASAALAALAVASSPALAQPARNTARTVTPVGQYPIVFTPTGQWELTYTWPGHPTEHDLETFAPDPTRTSTFGYQVYRSTECSLDHAGPLLDGTIWAEFYVYPNGMLVSGLRPGNGPTQPGGDMGTITGQAPNDTSQPLVFSGPWLNARGPGGTFTLARLTRPTLCQITPSTPPSAR